MSEVEGPARWNLPGRFINRTKTIFCQELSFNEVSGALGDLGTLIPLLIAMARIRAIYFGPALFLAGMANLLTGYAWDVPMCVQPMKSIAAVAISTGLTRNEVTAAGVLIGAMMTVIGGTGFIEAINYIIPGTVVSGIQIGVGIRLLSKGIKMVQPLGWTGQGGDKPADSILLGVCTAILTLVWLHRNRMLEESRAAVAKEKEEEEKAAAEGCEGCSEGFSNKRTSTFQHPVGIYLFIIGLAFALHTLITTDNPDNKYNFPLKFFHAGVVTWAMDDLKAEDWRTGFFEGALPQLPLTTLNSVISVCALAHTLYPDRKNIADQSAFRKEVALSVGIMNLVMCPFGAMPNCHGAGGLAAQHRLGARHGASVAALGLAKVIIAIVCGGDTALAILDALPDSVLGVMLVLAGCELAVTGALYLGRIDGDREKKRRGAVVSIITTGVIISVGKTHYGALSGWSVFLIYDDGLSFFYSKTREFLGGKKEDVAVKEEPGKVEEA